MRPSRQRCSVSAASGCPRPLSAMHTRERPDDTDAQSPIAQWPDSLTPASPPAPPPASSPIRMAFKILYLQLAEDYLRKDKSASSSSASSRTTPPSAACGGVRRRPEAMESSSTPTSRERKARKTASYCDACVGSDTETAIAVERLSKVDIELVGENIKAAELQLLHNEVFDVESVSKEFFNEISNWYFGRSLK